MKQPSPQREVLALPSIPAAYSETEAVQILAILRNAEIRTRPHDGDFQPPWLLSAFENPLWYTSHRGREEQIHGRWRRTIDVHWDQVLPNGARLGDPEYSLLLSTLKKVAVLLRSGHLGRALAPAVWRPAVSTMLLVARWLVLHEARYRPATHGFALLDQNGLTLLLRQLARGGWTEALQIPQRLLSTWYVGAFRKACPQALLDDPYTLPDEIRAALTSWLTAQHYYRAVGSGRYAGRRCLDRQRLASDVHAALTLLRASHWVSAFCRQFEPDFSDSPLLLSTYLNNEYPDQRTPTSVNGGRDCASLKILQDVGKTVERLLSARRHLPGALPAPQGLSVPIAYEAARSQASPNGHTAFIPIQTGLTYLNEAIRWVHGYGEAIVEDYLSTISRLDLSTLKRLSPAAQTAAAGEAFRLGPRTLALTGANGKTRSVRETLGIESFDRPNNVALDFEALRHAPALTEALDVLIGACIVCIGLLKPSRESELTHLTRDCLTQRHDGYYLRFRLGKSNAGEAYQSREKPIPLITAQAVRLMQRLGEELTRAFGETGKRRNDLFYLPRRALGEVRIANSSMLNRCLDQFCDYVGLPPDAEGRRWYVRVHEMRKWFLLLLFWAGRFDILDAVRWMAGHTKADHTYAYLEQEFPGEELPGIEAEYSIDRLRRWDRACREGGAAPSSREEPGLEALYDNVCRHFDAASLLMISEREWADYVMALRKRGGFSLHPHSVYGCDESGERRVGVEVSFVLEETRA